MTPRLLMILGITIFLITSGLWIVYGLNLSPILPFVAGAVFGKGYGVWETRSNTKRTENGRSN